MWRCHSREVLHDGPAGTGKSRAILEKLHVMASNYPGCRILIARKTRASLTESVLVTYERDVVPQFHGIISGQKRSHRQAYSYPNGSTIVLGGLDRVERILSTEYDCIWVNEATEITENDWETLLTRLRNGVVPYQQAIADCNPSYPRHWLKVRADEGKMHRIISRHEDNPTCTEEYLATLKSLSGHRRQRLFLGKWAAADGLIYDRWDDRTHILQDGLETPRMARIAIGIDEGYTNPCSMHVYGLDNDGRMYVLAEWVKTQQLEKAVVSQAKVYAALYPQELEAVVVDPSAAKLIAALREADLPVTEANNDVFGGIQRCQQRLEVQGDGRPRLFVHPSCTNFIAEVNAYQWKENRDGSHEDKPAKVNDHSMDEWRYVNTYFEERSGSMEVFAI